MADPFIELKGITREYPSGEGTIAVLKDVDLTIDDGEMVAIVGASGSGKSTLMNILGCLDRPTAGSYRLQGREASALSPDELAELRREHFGFIFQRYHLLAELTALGNVEIPAIYAGADQRRRRDRAAALLGRLGMTERTSHRPGQLSGGQQQRVSIARALMNDARVILADEPTGALDSHSGQEVLRILDELHAEGRTVVIVTHDKSIAARADRIVEISDGVIVSDERTSGRCTPSRGAAAPAAADDAAAAGALRGLLNRGREAFRMAVLAMRAHRLRTFLTMLGIIIGIASVVSVVALGSGTQQKILENISSLGTSTLQIFAGTSYGDTRSGRITTLVVDDAEALARQPYVAAVTPAVTTSVVARYDSVEANAQVTGVGDRYFDATGMTLVEGRLFDAAAVRDMAQEAVLDENARDALFGDDAAGLLGRTILLGKVPLRVVGIVETSQTGPGGSENLTIYTPYTTVQARILGSMSLRSITVKVDDGVDTGLAEQAVTEFLTRRHGSKDFFIINSDDIRATITSTTQTMQILIAAIAVISLVVGGIGVMNIMLVSVSERVSEIGVRMAVGARQGDIMQQFLIEAVLVCLIGGFLGIAAALGFGLVFTLLDTGFGLVYSTTSIVAAFLCSSLIGVAFGYLPARNASRLDPVAALAKG
ncbi:MacB family efflux pump subunit [Aquibium sp. ELW1220]|uniref:MacB family efflux pump subunit n=1 Tax=Aquibium sp. ELW1220 TaxID=2976766 RepID=UPI0025AFC15B|nr:MacB family efflux pump subunit [Aquibium sp. ELW1220]MDN2581206.1 MacB family efflux pump subunit [Aquibium sp. ELW1220]